MSRPDTLTNEPHLARSIAKATDATVSTRAFDRVTAAVDASHLSAHPRAVVKRETIAEIAALFA